MEEGFDPGIVISSLIYSTFPVETLTLRLMEMPGTDIPPEKFSLMAFKVL